MSVSLYSVKLARSVLLIQLATFVLIGALFTLKSVPWGASAIAGGLAAWLPNILFMMVTRRIEAQTSAKGKIAWNFALGEALKVFATVIFLIVALGGFNAVFFPLGLGWLSVLVVQILAPAVINNKG